MSVSRVSIPLSATARWLAPLVMALALSAPSFAVDPIYTGFLSSTALDGYDTVAYFKMGKPVAGSSDHSTEWNGATWHFSSAENLATFQADPEAYAPQYGGYCAWAAAQNKTAPGDPNAWKIVDGKLYVNVNASIQARWEKDIPGFIAKADANWPGLLAGN